MRETDYVAKLMSIAQSDDPTKSIDVRIAQVMLMHLKELGNMQNQELAMLCYVDAATVSRFVRSLGFLKFGEFKSYFREYNEIYHQEYYYPNKKLPQSEDVFRSNVEALTYSFDLINFPQIEKVSKMIVTEKNILLGGDRFSQLVAQDFQLKLLSLGIYAKTYSDMNLQFEEIKNNKGIFILFSASFTRSQTIVSLAKKRGWKVIIITRNKLAKGDEVILYDNQHLSDWTINSVNDRLCMGMMVDQIILKIATSARN